MAAAAELVEPRLPLHVFSSFLSAVTALCFAFRPPSPSLHLPCPALCTSCSTVGVGSRPC